MIWLKLKSLTTNVMHNEEKIYKIIRFIIIGGFNTIHNLLWFSIFGLLNINYIVSYVLAYAICMVISYYLNCLFVFKTPPTLKKFIAFPLSSIPNFIISSLAIVFLVDGLHWNKYIANLCSAVIAIPITYVIVHFILTQKKKK